MTKSPAARRAALTGLAAVATVGLVLGTASPALAAGRTLAAGDSMFVLECEEPLAIQLYGVDASTAASTPIGEPPLEVGDGCAYQAAHDVTTGISYFVELRDIDGQFTSLFTVNTVTGVAAEIADESAFHDTDSTIDIISIAIGPNGAAYAIDDSNWLYSLNLGTAEVTPIVQLADGTFYAFGADPTSGVFYVANAAGDLYSLNVADGALTPVFVLNFGAGTTSPESLQVDSAGVLWFINDGEQVDELWSTSTTAGSEVLSGEFLNGEPNVGTDSLLVVPAPRLSATGAALDAGLVFGAFGALLLGGALVLMRQSVLRRRATSA